MVSVVIRRGAAFLLLLGLHLILGACVRRPEPPVPVYRPESVRDVEVFPQDLNWFAQQAGGDVLLVDAARSAQQAARFRSLFFSAWKAAKPGKGNEAFFRAELARAGEKRGYAENLQPWDETRWRQMALNADWENFPSLRQPAVTVRPVGLRLAPTALPRFEHPGLPGQGYPFDMFQQTALPAGFPLLILHRSLDAAWYYVESALASGWIEAGDVALADESFRNAWQALPLAALVRDDVPLIAAGGVFLARAGIGTVLPLAGQNGEKTTLLAPARGADGRALARRVRVDRSAAVPMPLPLSPANIAAVGNRLLGEPYGWGGLNGDRDCSAMLRDLFAPFGLWLPRNSASQARAGQFVSFEGLDSAAREALVRREGVPFLTLLWLRGHIGLYVGQYQGQAAFFHNLWGLRTRDRHGKEGRHVLGRAVITSTRPGRERADVPAETLLLNRMQGMALLGRE